MKTLFSLTLVLVLVSFAVRVQAQESLNAPVDIDGNVSNKPAFSVTKSGIGLHLDAAASGGLVGLTAGAKLNGSNVFTYTTSNRGASRLLLHDGAIFFMTGAYASGTRPSGSAIGDVVPELDYHNSKMAINNLGQVGIGGDYSPFTLTKGFPTDESYKLAVTGKIIAEEVKVQLTSNWPDYVFAEDYELLSLKETATFIEENKHLPGVPSAYEVANENGIMVGEMNRVLLEKIEELYLHVIDLERDNAKLKDMINRLIQSNDNEL